MKQFKVTLTNLKLMICVSIRTFIPQAITKIFILGHICKL